MRGSPNPLHSAISNCAGADHWNQERKDGGTKIESGDVLERPDEVVDIEYVDEIGSDGHFSIRAVLQKN